MTLPAECWGLLRPAAEPSAAHMLPVEQPAGSSRAADCCNLSCLLLQYWRSKRARYHQFAENGTSCSCAELLAGGKRCPIDDIAGAYHPMLLHAVHGWCFQGQQCHTQVELDPWQCIHTCIWGCPAPVAAYAHLMSPEWYPVIMRPSLKPDAAADTNTQS